MASNFRDLPLLATHVLLYTDTWCALHWNFNALSRYDSVRTNHRLREIAMFGFQQVGWSIIMTKFRLTSSRPTQASNCDRNALVETEGNNDDRCTDNDVSGRS